MSSNTYKPSPADIKALRERSGAGMLDVRNALVDANGDAEAAFKALREAGIAKAAKLAGRETSEGRIGAYVHTGRRRRACWSRSAATPTSSRTPTPSRRS